jgi:cytochrome c oxidase subunit II
LQGGWRRVHRRPHERACALGAAAAAALTSCSENAPSVLDPRGPAAERIEGLWWLMLWISAAVFAIVLALLAIAVVRARRTDARPDHEARWGEPFVVVGGVVAPIVILAFVFVVALKDMSALSSPERDPTTTVDVIGNDWWWEASYVGSNAETANEIHIPVGEPVRVRLTTDDVIHSFWVPQLQAKIDMVPGRVNTMWLQADEPGRYRGQCAEFCGLQHANMIFYVVAEPADEFRAWLAREQEPASEPSDESSLIGRDVFMRSTCVGCHAIRGTEADADIGPDLTHLARRETLAAGVLRNTRTDLALFITDPQEVKPGAAMPPTDLTQAELDALLDYLEQLR